MAPDPQQQNLKTHQEKRKFSSKAGYYFETQLCLQKVWLRGWESPLDVFLSHILTIFRSLKQLLISCVWGRARTRAEESPLFSSSSSPSPSFPLSTSIFCSSGGFSTRFLLKYKNRLFPHYGSKSMLSTPYDYIKNKKNVWHRSVPWKWSEWVHVDTKRVTRSMNMNQFVAQSLICNNLFSNHIYDFTKESNNLGR